MALRITLGTGQQHIVDFNHESTLTVTNLGQAEPGAPLSERTQAWTDIVQVESIAENDAVATGDNPDPSSDAPSAAESLLEKTRDELNAIAEQLGIVEPHKLPNKQAVADAIAPAVEAVAADMLGPADEPTPEPAPDVPAADVPTPDQPDTPADPAPAADAAPADDSPAT